MSKILFITSLLTLSLLAEAKAEIKSSTFNFSCENGIKMQIIGDSGYMHFNVIRISIEQKDLSGIYDQSVDGYSWLDPATGKTLLLSYDQYNPAGLVELSTSAMEVTQCKF